MQEAAYFYSSVLEPLCPHENAAATHKRRSSDDRVIKNRPMSHGAGGVSKKRCGLGFECVNLRAGGGTTDHPYLVPVTLNMSLS